jgi:hypothetical protein
VRSNDLARETFARSASLSRHVRQADRQVHRDDCGILRKVQKVLEGHHVEAEFARIEIFEHGAPFALETICAAKPDHLAPTAKIFAPENADFLPAAERLASPDLHCGLSPVTWRAGVSHPADYPGDGFGC